MLWCVSEFCVDGHVCAHYSDVLCDPSTQEKFAWDGDTGHITLHLTFNVGSFDGRVKHVKRVGWVLNPSQGSEWRVQTTAFGLQLHPMPWIIISCAKDYGPFCTEWNLCRCCA